MFPYQPLTRREFGRWLQQPQAWASVAVLSLLLVLLVLSLASCSDMPTLLQRGVDAPDVDSTSVSPVAVSTEPLATAPVEPTDSSEFRGRGGLVSVDAETGTNSVETTANHGMVAGDGDLGSVAAEDLVLVLGLATPLGRALRDFGTDPAMRATLGVGEVLNARVGAGVTAHALVARGSQDAAGATLEAN